MTGDAGILYDAGTEALAQGRLGEAVAFLVAARRVDPRAADARRNLAIAERAVAATRGEPGPPVPGGATAAVSTAEAWWLAALLLALAAMAGIPALLSGTAHVRRVRILRRVSVGALAAGVLLTAWLGAAAIGERRHPEAVVVAPSVEARRGVDEAPRAPILLREGERVRTGRAHGDDVEVFIGGSPIGWVPRAALWHVADAPRYTAGFRSK